MKKNRTMRLAALLLVLTLITSCFVGGTFARYTTTDSGSDDARVAEWGVVITTSTDGLFSDTYVNEEAIGETAISAGISVDSSEANGNDDVVAPGTEGSVTFSIAGTPEVAVDVAIVMTVSNDVKIPVGTVIADEALATDYTPVVFTLTGDKHNQPIASGTLTQIKAGLEGLSAQYAPNTKLDETYTLSWAWDINGNNAADTYLGNVAAGTVNDTNTITDIDFDFDITVTQID